MTTVSKDYAQPSFKGVEFNPATWEVGFSQEQGEHKFLFKDEKFIQPQGRTNITFKAGIPFSQNDKQIADAFRARFPLFFDACSDGEPGTLVTPDRGELRAACVSLSYSLVPTMQDGTMVDVQWVKAPAIDDFSSGFDTATNLTAGGGIVFLQRQFDDVVVPETVKKPNLPSIFTAIQSLNDQVVGARETIKARIDSAIFTAKRMEDIVASYGSVDDWSLSQQLRAFQLQMIRIKRAFGSKDGGGPVVAFVPSDTSVDEFAAHQHVTVESLYILNPDLSLSPIISGGSYVKFIPGK
jgi:prophage DNA circulation protein